MGRMHNPGKGISRSSIPYKRAPPSWLKVSTEEVCQHICKLAKKGYTPSQVSTIGRALALLSTVPKTRGSGAGAVFFYDFFLVFYLFFYVAWFI